MRVLAVAHSFVVPTNRARWHRLAERHPDTDVTLIVPAFASTDRYGVRRTFAVEEEWNKNFRVVPIPIAAGTLYRSLTLRLRRFRPDVIQVNEELTEWVLLQCFMLARILSPSAVRLFYYYTTILSRPSAIHNKLKFRAVLKLADGALVGSRASDGVVRALGLDAPTYIQTEIGADERLWVPKGEPARTGTVFTVGFVGALVPEKGAIDLTHALLALGTDWRLVIVGDGPERHSIEMVLAGAGLRHRVEMKGFVAREFLPAIVRRFDVLVLPSRSTPNWNEQFGLVLAEAMLAEVAVVGSSSGAIPEVIGSCGLVYPEGDHQRLAAHLTLLAEHPEYRLSLAARGRERALALYSASALADQTYALFRGLIGERFHGSVGKTIR